MRKPSVAEASFVGRPSWTLKSSFLIQSKNDEKSIGSAFGKIMSSYRNNFLISERKFKGHRYFVDMILLVKRVKKGI